MGSNCKLIHTKIHERVKKMKHFFLRSLLSATVLAFACSSANAVVVTSNSNAAALAGALAGSGISISNAVLTRAAFNATGTFTEGGNIGFGSGVLLTTGNINCAVGPNTRDGCSGAGDLTSLKFDFTSTTGNVFFNYIFASEEYNEYVGTPFNDLFELRLNGVNIARLPGGAGEVSINNVNLGINPAYYRDNNTGLISTEYDGLTTVLNARAFGLVGTNTFEFLIMDGTDTSWDSGVFIQAGTFAADPTEVPAPGSFALVGLGLAGLLAAKRNKV